MAALSLELDLVVVGERPSDDALQVLQAPLGSDPFASSQILMPLAERFAPQDVDGALPARAEESGREIEGVGHVSLGWDLSCGARGSP
jgi:hypothetical protein